MGDRTLFPWRAPLSADWTERWSAADARVRELAPGQVTPEAASEICTAVRRLASERLGPREQLKLEGLARRLMPHAACLKPLRHFRVGLIGNRTLTFLINPLRAAGLARGLLIDAREAPYDSAASFAFGDANVFGAEKLDAVAVVLDEGAFRRSSRLSDRAAEDCETADAEKFLSQLAAAARKLTSAPAMVATIPQTAPALSSADLATAGTLPRFLMRLNMEIALGGERGDWILWDLAGLAGEIGYGNWFDPLRFHEAKTPFRIEFVR